MTVHSEEKIQFYASLSRWAIDNLGKALAAERKAVIEGGLAPSINNVGDDVDPADLRDIELLFSNQLPDVTPYREAQLRELAFWRWVAFEGYAGLDARAFPLMQEHFMVSTFYRTGWSRAEFVGAKILELGCGPLGMIEYVPAAERIAFDPLNAYYSKLFSRYRSSTIRYLSQREELVEVEPGIDFGICHNVIDHTSEPNWWFDTMFGKLKQGGRFLFQVNVSRKDVEQPEAHRRMHPSPFTYEQIMEWLGAKSVDFQHSVEQNASSDGEFYFLAWGTKSKDDPVKYTNLIA